MFRYCLNLQRLAQDSVMLPPQGEGFDRAENRFDPADTKPTFPLPRTYSLVSPGH